MRLRLLAAAILAGSLYAADPGLLSMAQPNSQLMAGVNVEQVMLSPLGQFLMTQTDPNLDKLIAGAGFDPRRDLREILVSSTGKPGSGAAIVLARGTFDVPKIIEAAQAFGSTAGTYKGVSIIQNSKQESLAFPDSTLAIAGDTAGVRAAINRISAPTPISSALAVEVDQLSTTEDAWFVSIAPFPQLQAATGGADAGPFGMLNNVQQASGGVKFGANVAVNLQAVSQTDQDASALAVALKALAGIGQVGDSKGDAALAAVLLSLSVTADGKTTTISLTVPERQIEQRFQASGADAPVRARPPGRAAAPAPASGATPQRIRVGSNVQRAKLVEQPAPIYPPLARQARISGAVRLNVIIGMDGTVQNITVDSGHPLLVPAALDAVKQWVYQPTLLNGQAVEVATQVEVNFALEQ